MTEGSGSRARSGSITLTDGSGFGSWRPKKIWILQLRIRIRDIGKNPITSSTRLLKIGLRRHCLFICNAKTVGRQAPLKRTLHVGYHHGIVRYQNPWIPSKQCFGSVTFWSRFGSGSASPYQRLRIRILLISSMANKVTSKNIFSPLFSAYFLVVTVP